MPQLQICEGKGWGWHVQAHEHHGNFFLWFACLNVFFALFLADARRCAEVQTIWTASVLKAPVDPLNGRSHFALHSGDLATCVSSRVCATNSSSSLYDFEDGNGWAALFFRCDVIEVRCGKNRKDDHENNLGFSNHEHNVRRWNARTDRSRRVVNDALYYFDVSLWYERGLIDCLTQPKTDPSKSFRWDKGAERRAARQRRCWAWKRRKRARLERFQILNYPRHRWLQWTLLMTNCQS